MYPEIITFTAGAVGQLVRGLIGLSKSIQAGEQIDWKRFILSVILGCIIGGCAGYMFGNNIPSAFGFGFSGVDVFDSAVELRKLREKQ